MKPKSTPMPLPRTRGEWEELATLALRELLHAERAVVPREAEARLAETDWVHQHYDRTIPPTKGPQPHHIGTAARTLEALGELVVDTVTLQGRSVTAWLDGAALRTRNQTGVATAAGMKRRLYRSYLGWTGNARLCGDVAELTVHASIESLTGRRLWLPPGTQPGRVSTLLGRRITVGGPLDSHALWVVDPNDPGRGFVPFAVEVKNVRSWLYPWDHETWDLLAKLGDFPDVVPVLVARRIHPITFRFFADIGALGHAARAQWFTDLGLTRASIDSNRFQHVVSQLNFRDATLLDDPAVPQPSVTRFFGETAYGRQTPAGPTLAERALERWAQAAPLVAGFPELRDEALANRQAIWAEFAQLVVNAGLYERGSWAPQHMT